jgi:hypothetical protein
VMRRPWIRSDSLAVRPNILIPFMCPRRFEVIPKKHEPTPGVGGRICKLPMRCSVFFIHATVSLLAKKAKDTVITAATKTCQLAALRNIDNLPKITTTGPMQAQPIFLSNSHVASKNWRMFAQL